MSKWIYESPDKGKTVTRRSFGTEQKHDVEDYDKRTADGRPLIEQIREDKLWGEIRRAATTNPALHEALERAKIIYHLSKE